MPIRLLLLVPMAITLLVLLKIGANPYADAVVGDSVTYLDPPIWRPAFYPRFVGVFDALAPEGTVQAVVGGVQMLVGAVATFWVGLVMATRFGWNRAGVLMLQSIMLLPYTMPESWFLRLLSEGLAYPLFWVAVIGFASAMLLSGRRADLMVAIVAMVIGILSRPHFMFVLAPMVILAAVVFIRGNTWPGQRRRAAWGFVVPFLVFLATMVIDRTDNLLRHGIFEPSSSMGIQLIVPSLYVSADDPAPVIARLEREHPSLAPLMAIYAEEMREWKMSLAAARYDAEDVTRAANQYHYLRVYNDVIRLVGKGPFAGHIEGIERPGAVYHEFTPEETVAGNRAFVQIAVAGIAEYPQAYAAVVIKEMVTAHETGWFYLVIIVAVILIGAVYAWRGEVQGMLLLYAACLSLFNAVTICFIESNLIRYSFYTDVFILAVVLGIWANSAFSGGKGLCCINQS